MAYEDAWNSTSIELVGLAELHGRVIIVETFRISVEKCRNQVSRELFAVLEQLLQLYAVNTALRCCGDLLKVNGGCIKKYMVLSVTNNVSFTKHYMFLL